MPEQARVSNKVQFNRETALSMLDAFLRTRGFEMEEGFENWWRLSDLLYYCEAGSFSPGFIIIFLDNEFKMDPPERPCIMYLGRKLEKLREYFMSQMAQAG